MGINRITIDGYASLELNRVSFPITGRVIADLPLNAAFNTATPAENGMILGVDFVGGAVNFPTGSDTILALHYSPEREYDPSISGLNQFKLVANNANARYQGSSQAFYPRLGMLSVAEKFTSNCLCYNTSIYANEAVALAAMANYATTPVYGIPNTTGAIEITTTLGTPKVGLQMIANTTVPNGDIGVKFVVIVAQ